MKPSHIAIPIDLFEEIGLLLDLMPHGQVKKTASRLANEAEPANKTEPQLPIEEDPEPKQE